MTAEAATSLMDGPQVQLHPAQHVYPQVAVELLGRVAEATTGDAWHVSTALFGDDLLVVGIDPDTLQTGLAAERALWEAAVVQLTAAAELLPPNLGFPLAQPLLDAQLRAEQADLLLGAVADVGDSDRRDGARRFVAGHQPLVAGASSAPGVSRHGCEPVIVADGLDANGVDVDAAYERQVQRLHDRRYGDGASTMAKPGGGERDA